MNVACVFLLCMHRPLSVRKEQDELTGLTETKEMKRRNKLMIRNVHRGTILAVGTAVMFFAGIIYGWSILKAPLQSSFGWTAPQLALNFTLTMCMFCIGGLISGMLLPKVSLKLLLFTAGFLSSTGFWYASGCGAEHISRLYAGYGILAGLGIGIAYNAVISVVNEWYADKKGTSSGVLMMSFGASALILGNIADWLMNGALGWRACYRLLGALTGMSMLAAAVVISHPEGTRNNSRASVRTDGQTSLADTAAQTRDAGIRKTSGADYTPLEMLRRPSFWRFFLFLILACAVGNSTISMARDVAVSVGAGTGLAALLAGILSLCNGVGRLIAGALFDRYGQRYTMNIDGVITIIAPLVMLAAIAGKSVVLCAAGLCLTGFSYSFQPPVTSSVVADFYGTKHFPVNYSIANLMMIPTSFAATAAGALYGSTGSYAAPFGMLLLFSIVSFFLNRSIRHA